MDKIEMADGSIVVAEVPGRYDITLKLRLTGKVNEQGYFTPQLKSIGVGAEIIFKSKWFSAEGDVISISN
jgi:hypothetical protein